MLNMLLSVWMPSRSMTEWHPACAGGPHSLVTANGGSCWNKVLLCENSPIFVEAGAFRRFSTKQQVKRGREGGNTRQTSNRETESMLLPAILERPFPSNSLHFLTRHLCSLLSHAPPRSWLLYHWPVLFFSFTQWRYFPIFYVLLGQMSTIVTMFTLSFNKLDQLKNT